MTAAPEWLEPVKIGPTWQHNADGSWLLPDRTLGWEVAGWVAKWLRDPRDSAKPFIYTNEQLRWLLWWFAVDCDGTFIHRTGTLQRLKGWGKDPMLATLALIELVGPSRFAGWSDSGEPLGAPHPSAWVQVAAVNQDQTRNTMALMPALMSDAFITQYQIKPGAELIRAHGGRQRLEAVTSSYRALEGGRATFVGLNETHHWVKGNNGDLMYETIDGNATKMDGRYLAITNAYLPGEESVAERMHQMYLDIEAGKSVDVGYMYDSLEAHPNAPLTAEAALQVIPLVRGDAVWLKPETILASIQNSTMSPARSRRMWYNQVVAGEDSLFQLGDWLPLYDPRLRLKAGDKIVLGFDGGKTDDSTALVAIRVKDNAVFLLGLWEKPNDETGRDWQVPRERVDNAVHAAFREHEVAGFYADVALWESYIAEWERLYGDQLEVKSSAAKPIAWDMRQSLQKVTRANERLVQTILDRKLRHDGNKMLQRHVLNVMRRENNYGVSFGKAGRESPRKVDAYAAMLLAYEALLDLRGRGKTTKPKTGRSYWL